VKAGIMTLAATLILIGRIVLGLFFVIAGIRNLWRLPSRLVMKTNYGWTLPPAATVLGFATQLVAGFSLIINLWPVWGAIALILFLIAATALFHNFLLFKGEERLPHLYFTLVNCALVGYCLIVIGNSVTGP
jgi:putative oxidoreductase